MIKLVRCRRNLQNVRLNITATRVQAARVATEDRTTLEYRPIKSYALCKYKRRWNENVHTCMYRMYCRNISTFWILVAYSLFSMCKCFFNLTGDWTRLTAVYCVVKVSKLNERCPFGGCMGADNNRAAIRFSLSEYPNDFFHDFIALTGVNGKRWFLPAGERAPWAAAMWNTDNWINEYYWCSGIKLFGSPDWCLV